jgi:hypothetical protein
MAQEILLRFSVAMTLKTYIVISCGAVACVAGCVALWNKNRIIARYVFSRDFVFQGENLYGLKEYKHTITGMTFVLIEKDENRFVICKHEVSQSAWIVVMGYNNSLHIGQELPVESVTYSECVEFCRQTMMELPTEQQWEEACTASEAPLVTDSSGAALQSAEYYDPIYPINTIKTRPIGLYFPNKYGIYDMNGNVWEWCKGTEWLRAPVRGGSYAMPMDKCGCDSRVVIPRQGSTGQIGFRPVLTLW